MGMNSIDWLIAVGLAVAAGQAGAQTPSTATGDAGKADRPGQVSKSDAEAFIAQCGLRKFETEVESDNGGKLRKAKILLCAKPGESDEQWIATLDKAAKQIAASPQLSAEAKAKVAGEIQAAIGVVRGQPAPQAQTAVAPGGRAFDHLQPLPDADRIVATVRPLPPPPKEMTVQLPASTSGPMAGSKPGPMRLAPVHPVARPAMTISCSWTGDPGSAGVCDELSAATLLVIHADADVKSKVSVRFIRDGDPRGEIALAPMRRGQIVRARLPARVCGGVVRGRVEIQTIVTDPDGRTEHVTDRLGPMFLRC
ncbi:MAG: hypothetical protein ABI626_09385 [Sphingomicrobium sp.]